MIDTHATSTQEPLSAEHEALWMLGFFYLRNNRPDKARMLFDALAHLHPQRPRLHCALALAQIRSDKAEQALATLDGLALNGYLDDIFHLLRAQALDALDRRGEAAAAMRAFVASRRAQSAAGESA